MREGLEQIRINKYLSEAGYCSRREADQLLLNKKVRINGMIAEVGMTVTNDDEVTVSGKKVVKKEKLVLIVLNKPRGIVCTTDQKREKDNVIDFIGYKSRIFPIGRLDKDSQGLLLLTNNGDIVNKILRSGNNHDKEYIVKVNKPITDKFLKDMASGVPILGTITKKCVIKKIDKTTFRIVLTQGLNRQIRRMCEYFGYKVIQLKRERIMNISLGHLKEGHWRNVTDKEFQHLKTLLSDSSKTTVIKKEKSNGIESKRTSKRNQRNR